MLVGVGCPAHLLGRYGRGAGETYSARFLPRCQDYLSMRTCSYVRTNVRVATRTVAD